MDEPSTSPADRAGPHLDEDRALDLLLDLLTEEDLAAAGRHLATCRACEDLVRRRGALLERRRAAQPRDVRAVRAQEPRQARWLEAIRRRTRFIALASPGPTLAAIRRLAPSVRKPGTVWAAAGVLAMTGLILVIGNLRTRPAPMVAEWLPRASETRTLRSRADQGGIAGLTAALTAYDRRDLESAIAALSDVNASGPTEALRLVYLGSSLTHAGRYREAVRILRSCPLAKVPEPWRGESRWTLAVALSGAGEQAAADSLVRALADQPGAIGARARRLLGRSGP